MKFVSVAAVLTALVATASAHGSSGNGHKHARMESRAAPLAQVVTKCTKAKTVALTFDDGPSVYAYDISKTLIAAGAKGTFFFNGNNVELAPNFECIYDADQQKRVKYIYDHGHQVGSHTWAHLHLPTLSASKIDSEMQRAEQALQRILGVQPRFTRVPYGEYNNVVRQVAHKRNMTLANWDVDTEDSLGATVARSKKLFDDALKKNPNALLVLNHERFLGTVQQVLPYMIGKLKAKGYKMVTLAECLGKEPYQWKKAPQTPDPSWKC